MKKYMSKAMVLLMVGALAIGSVACSNTAKQEDAAVEVTTEVNEVVEDIAEMDETDGLALIQEIYDTEAGTPGSDERVQAAADDFITYAQKHEEEMTLEFACETVRPALETVRGDLDAETFKANFQECVDAVKEAVAAKDATMTENDSYKCMVRAMEIELGEMK